MGVTSKVFDWKEKVMTDKELSEVVKILNEVDFEIVNVCQHVMRKPLSILSFYEKDLGAYYHITQCIICGVMAFKDKDKDLGD